MGLPDIEADNRLHKGPFKRRPKKAVKLEDVPKFVQKCTTTYFKFREGLVQEASILAGKNRSPANESRVSKSFVVNSSKADAYARPKVDALSQSMNKSLTRRNSLGEDDSAFLCNVCFGKEADTIFMECGHGGLCLQCAYDIWGTSDECYLCRETIDYLVRYDIKDKKGDLFKILEVHQES